MTVTLLTTIMTLVFVSCGSKNNDSPEPKPIPITKEQINPTVPTDSQKPSDAPAITVNSESPKVTLQLDPRLIGEWISSSFFNINGNELEMQTEKTISLDGTITSILRVISLNSENDLNIDFTFGTNDGLLAHVESKIVTNNIHESFVGISEVLTKIFVDKSEVLGATPLKAGDIDSCIYRFISVESQLEMNCNMNANPPESFTIENTKLFLKVL